MVKGNWLMLSIGEPSGVPSVVTYISYYDIDNCVFVLRRRIEPTLLSEFPGVPTERQAYGVVFVIAKCTYADQTYKVYYQNRILEKTVFEIIEDSGKGDRLVNAIIVNEEQPSETHIRLKKGKLLKYSGSGQNRMLCGLPPVSQCCALLSIKTGISEDDNHSEGYHKGGLDFYTSPAKALAMFKKRASQFCTGSRIEDTGSGISDIAPSAEICGTSYTYAGFSSAREQLSLIKMAFYDTKEPVYAEGCFYGVYIDTHLPYAKTPSLTKVYFFRSKANATAYFNNISTYISGKLKMMLECEESNRRCYSPNFDEGATYWDILSYKPSLKGVKSLDGISLEYTAGNCYADAVLFEVTPEMY